MKQDTLLIAKIHKKVLVKNVLSKRDLSSAQDALQNYYPTVEEYDTNPKKYTHLQGDQFAGLVMFPFVTSILNNLPTHPSIVGIVEHILEFQDIRVLKACLQAKFAGAADYEQMHHYDYPNHTLVVPNLHRPEPNSQNKKNSTI